jgi:hypothetical protein
VFIRDTQGFFERLKKPNGGLSVVVEVRPELRANSRQPIDPRVTVRRDYLHNALLLDTITDSAFANISVYRAP